MNIESVYTANAFVSGGRTLVGAGSETTPAVYLQDLTTGESSLVADCPGGVMSFVPVPEHEDVYFSVMGLFPGFQGLEAGIHMHVYSEGKWTTRKVFDLPFAHRCDVVRRDGKNYLFAMNGQTGRLIGYLPISKGKFLAWFAGIAVPLMAVMALLFT